MEIHRQTLRTVLLVNVFGGPICSQNFTAKPPRKVLEVGCGNGYWSALCHKHFARQGHTVSFVGLDVAPISVNSGDKPNGIKWRFVQHDLRRTPLPFKDGEFDLVMAKDLSLVSGATSAQGDLMDEYIRILAPGGTLEIWDSDHTIRMLLPQESAKRRPHTTTSPDDDSSSEEEDEDEAHATATGTYLLSPSTPFKEAQNSYFQDYNDWLLTVLTQRGLPPSPCTLIRPLLVQEPDLTAIQTRRLAIPLGHPKWEVDHTKHPPNSKSPPPKRQLTTGQAALRHTALYGVSMFLQSMEPLLKEASGKNQREWDRWAGLAMEDWFGRNGASWGECLEVGAWWATKKVPKVSKFPQARTQLGGKLAAGGQGSATGHAQGQSLPHRGGKADTEKELPAFPPEPHPGREWKLPHLDFSK
jgi:SAM-dependent methyltransferase